MVIGQPGHAHLKCQYCGLGVSQGMAMYSLSTVVGGSAKVWPCRVLVLCLGVSHCIAMQCFSTVFGGQTVYGHAKS